MSDQEELPIEYEYPDWYTFDEYGAWDNTDDDKSYDYIFVAELKAPIRRIKKQDCE